MVESTRWGIVYCPRGGQSKNSKRWKKIQQQLDARGVSYDFVQSEDAGSVERLVTMLISGGYKTIVIVGGDSALNDAVNCLMKEERRIREEITLGLIPNGVMNDFARYWGFSEDDDEQTIASLSEHRTRRIDLGCIRYTNAQGKSCHRYFLNCINIGLTADIMNLRRRARRLFGSRTLSFLSSLVVMLFHRMDYAMRLRINSDDIDRKVMTLCIGNCRGYGQTPNAVPYNGLLDASVVYNAKATQLLSGLWLLVTGRLLNHRSVHPYRTREIQIEKVGRALVGIDGRLMKTPAGPFRVTIEPEVINLLIPK